VTYNQENKHATTVAREVASATQEPDLTLVLASRVCIQNNKKSNTEIQ
jgi:hypothetical protein